MSGTDKLVYMANQIARNFEIHGTDEASAMTAEHIRKFWDPRMRAAIAGHVAAGGKDLSEIALAAIRDACRLSGQTP